MGGVIKSMREGWTSVCVSGCEGTLVVAASSLFSSDEFQEEDRTILAS